MFFISWVFSANTCVEGVQILSMVTNIKLPKSETILHCSPEKCFWKSGDPGFIDFKFSGKTMHACHAAAQIWLNRAIILKYGIKKKYSQNISKQFNTKTYM